MTRRDASLLSLIPLRLAAATLFGVGCSPASEAPPHNTGGFPSVGTGGTATHTGGFNGTTGGISSGFTGGTFGTTGGATGFTGGTSTGTTGGTTTTATGGTTTTATGGTTTTATGGTTTTATGGTAGGSSAACYAGTVAKASTILMDGYGTAKTGSWKGYAFTYTYGKATIKPAGADTGSCFKGAQVCAAGSVPADDNSGAGLGMNLSQVVATTTVGTVAVTTPVNITLAGAQAGMRIALSVSATEEYCYQLTADDLTAVNGTGLALALTKFTKDCYAAGGTAYPGTAIKAIQVAVPGSTTGTEKPFDFCLVDIEPG